MENHYEEMARRKKIIKDCENELKKFDDRMLLDTVMTLVMGGIILGSCQNTPAQGFFEIEPK